MDRLIYLLSLAAFASAFQAPLHYEYKYFGSVGSGIPELNNQMSGWAMKSDVHVYIEKDDGTAIIQLKNFEMADFNDKLGCDSRGDIPSELFYKLKDEKMIDAIGSPFRVNLFGKMDYAIEYGKEPYKWLINMRKGLVSLFRNQILKGNVEDSVQESITAAINNGHVVNAFSIDEETVLGRCKSDYTIHPIPKYLSGTSNFKLDEELKKDAQRGTKNPTGKFNRKAEVPEMKDDLWHVVRSIDLDHCDDKVALQLTPIGFNGDVSKQHYEWMRSRSSVTEYIFRGGPSQFRLEKAFLEGTTLAAPFGIKTDFLQSRINQTLQLTRVTSGDAVPTVPTSSIKAKTFMYTLIGSVPAPNHARPIPWIDYPEKIDPKVDMYEAYGIERFSEEQRSAFKKSAIEKISQASLQLTDFDQEMDTTSSWGIAPTLGIAVVHLKYMQPDAIKEVLDHFDGKEFHQHDILAKKLAIDAVAMAGTFHSVKALFDFIEEGKVSTIQVMTIFMTLATNTIIPQANIGQIMNYVLKLDIKEQPFLTSTVLVNFAELLYKSCSKSTSHIPDVKIFMGDYVCDKKMIHNKFLPHLKNMIFSDSSTWIKNVAIKSLGVLGMHRTLEILTPVIEERDKYDTRSRVLSIYALQSWRYGQDMNLRAPIIDFLTDIYSNIGEHPEVRKAALGALVSWAPAPTFWFSLAKLSWREPSTHIATFMTSLIQSFATARHPFYLKQNQAASHALKLAKPVVPTLKYSMLQMTSTHIAKLHASEFEVINQHIHKGQTEIHEFYFYLMTNLGGFQLTTEEGSIYVEGITKFFKNLMEERSANEDSEEKPYMKSSRDLYNIIEETIESQVKNEEKPELDIFLRMMENMNLYLPINKETVSSLELSDPTNLASFLVQLGLGYDFVLAKFIRLLEATSVHANELGLATIVYSSTTAVCSDSSYNTLKSEADAFSFDSLKKMKYSSEILSRFVSQSITQLAVLIPWAPGSRSAMISSTRDFTLPLNVAMKNDHSNIDGTQITFDISMSSLYKKKFPLMKSSSTPMTMFATLDFLDFTKIEGKPIFSRIPKEKTIKLPNTYAGLDLEIKWNSEISVSTVIQKFYSLIRNPEKLAKVKVLAPLLDLASLTAKFWSLEIKFDPEGSQTKDMTISLTRGIFGQESESNPDLEYDYGPDNFEDDAVDDEPSLKLSYKDTTEERSQKLKKYFGSKVTSMGVKFEFKGEEERSYEFLYAYSKFRVNERRKGRKARLAFLRSPVPDAADEEGSICFDVQRTYPSYWSYKDIDNLLEAELEKDIRAVVSIGCSKKPVMSAKGVYRISDKWKDIMKRDLGKSCDYDSRNPLYTFQSHAVYDDIKMAFSWENSEDLEKFPITKKLLKGVEKVINFFTNEDIDLDEGKRQIKIEAHRCSLRGSWYIDVEGEGLEHSIEDLPHDECFNWLFAAGWRSQHVHSKHLSSFNTESDSCIVGIDSVRTFDGFTYEYEPTQCWTVAAKDCLREKGKMLLVRSSQSGSTVPEIKYIDMKSNTVLELAGDTLMLNEKKIELKGYKKVITNEDGEKLMYIYKIEGSYYMKLHKRLYISVVKDKVRIHAPKGIMGYTCGLCGNFDGEKSGELVGPRRCYYDNPKLFAASWAVPEETCNDNSLLDLRKKAESYQKSCSTIDTLLNEGGQFNKRGYAFSWGIEKDGNGHLCSSRKPIPHCKDDVPLKDEHPMPIEFNCWPEDRAPKLLKNTIEANKYHINEAISASPFYINTFMHFNVSASCKYY